MNPSQVFFFHYYSSSEVADVLLCDRQGLIKSLLFGVQSSAMKSWTVLNSSKTSCYRKGPRDPEDAHLFLKP